MYDVIKKYDKVDPGLVELYSKLDESASIHESLGINNCFTMNMDIRPLWPSARLCGTAVTVKARPGDNLIIHKAISMLNPGDVLVVSTGRDNTRGGLWGGMMAAAAKQKGCRGLVTDGAVRDSIFIQKIDFPVFSRGISIKGVTKVLPGTINHPIIVGDVLVNPGDIVFADNDGIVIVPCKQAQEIYDKTFAREQKEVELLKQIRNGDGCPYTLAGFDETFRKLGLKEED